jgi:hypothetical protein
MLDIATAAAVPAAATALPRKNERREFVRSSDFGFVITVSSHVVFLERRGSVTLFVVGNHSFIIASCPLTSAFQP